MKPKVALIGLGRMGANMARRLHEQDFIISSVYDVKIQTAQVIALELSCPCATSLAEVTASADVILTIVTNDAAMRALFQKDALLQNARGKLFINCATVSPEVHQEVEAACQAVEARSLEACMASSITQARAGTLYLMCAGHPAVFAQAQPILQALSSHCRFIGPAGSAAQVKALVNMVMNINTAGLAEGLGLGNALGLDLSMLREVFAETGANSRVLETDGEDMQNRDHACFFSAAHAAKDSGIALQLARALNLKLPLATATLAQYELMTKVGLGELDKSGVAELTFKNRTVV